VEIGNQVFKMVEYDYVALHGKMAYQSKGMDCPADPYQLDGPSTSKALRLITKLVFNNALNARSRDGCLKACRQAISARNLPDANKYRSYKTGKKKDKADKRRAAYEECGRTFEDVYDRLLVLHAPIADLFSTDIGVRFQRRDSKIALSILLSLTLQGVPCLGVHDSFLVPACHEADLKETMLWAYYDEIGFWPAVERVDHAK
jgi:hypothetical protein